MKHSFLLTFLLPLLIPLTQSKKCTCPNGWPAPGRLCRKTNDLNCIACDRGYFMRKVGRSWSCNKNVCVCENGEPEDVANCIVHGGNQCKSCNAGYHVDDDKNCAENECHCHINDQQIGPIKPPPFICREHNTFACDSCYNEYA